MVASNWSASHNNSLETALGLLILIGTPVLRVAVLAVGWWMMGDRRFAAVALTVLALLGLSLALGLG
jgi:uncharacterized membrane protein